MQPRGLVRGVLANVDYEDPLTLYRAREVALEAKRKFLTRIEKCDPAILIDSFYVHYRKPILKKPTEIRDDKLLLWFKVVATYVQSQAYKSVTEVTYGNPRLSRLLAIKLLKVYLNMLMKYENNAEYSAALLAEVKSRSEGKEPSTYVKSIIHRLEYEIKTEIDFTIGNVRKVSEVVNRTKSIFGNVVGDEVAEILVDPEDESIRMRLVEMLRDLIELVRKATEVDLEEKYLDVRGYITGIKRMSNIRELKDMIPAERAKMNICKELAAYKLGTGNLLVHEQRVLNKPKVYMLVDKSGSMFYAIDVKVQDFQNLNKITWATALALTILLKGGKVIVRFFDKRAHAPLQDKAELVKTLLGLTPLGGTSITNALRTAIEDAKRNPSLRDYKLILITDGEDNNVDIATVQEVEKYYRDFTTVLVGGDNYVLEKYCRKVIKLKNIGLEALKTLLKKI